MNKYALEIENWTESDWELVDDFSSFDLAKAHGLTELSHNKWRVIDRRSGNIIYNHEPFSFIAADAARESTRFSERDRWRRHFADRQATEVRYAQERERNRERTRVLLEQRRNRLSGFNFVGARPEVTFDFLDDLASYEDEDDCRHNPLEDRVNWKIEGF